MKRAGVFLLVASLVVLLLFLPQSPEGKAPQFLPLRALPANAQYSAFNYLWHGPGPIAGDTLWVIAQKKGGYDWFLYDLKAGEIQGQLIDGQPPLVMTRDQSKILCSRPLPSRMAAFRDRLTRRIEALTSGRLRFHHPQSFPERYWLLDLEKNVAEKIGDIPMQPDTPCFLSPDGRRAYTTCIDSGRRGRRYVFCFDLEQGSLRRLDTGGWPSGWWDDGRLVVLENKDFVLHDLATGQNSAFLSGAYIKNFLQTNGITVDLTAIRAFAVWNGHENDFYLAEGEGWPGGDSFLVKIERPTKRLKLISPRFKFGWLDQFDSSGNLYLYSGRDASQGDAIFLHNFQTGQDRTLVPPTGNNTVTISLPRFYRDSAIYLRGNALWKINLDGTHNTRIFPP